MDEAENLIEDGWALMATWFYKLRKAKRYQEEYNELGIIMNMLMEDRKFLRETYLEFSSN